jgi:hypothetical protein
MKIVPAALEDGPGLFQGHKRGTIKEQSLFAWRNEIGGLTSEQAQRIKISISEQELLQSAIAHCCLLLLSKTRGVETPAL